MRLFFGLPLFHFGNGYQNGKRLHPGISNPKNGELMKAEPKSYARGVPLLRAALTVQRLCLSASYLD